MDPFYHSHGLRQQSREVRGRYALEEINSQASGKPLKFGAHKYHSPLYRELLMNVMPLRYEYRKI